MQLRIKLDSHACDSASSLIKVARVCKTHLMQRGHKSAAPGGSCREMRTMAEATQVIDQQMQYISCPNNEALLCTSASRRLILKAETFTYKFTHSHFTHSHTTCPVQLDRTRSHFQSNTQIVLRIARAAGIQELNTRPAQHGVWHVTSTTVQQARPRSGGTRNCHRHLRRQWRNEIGREEGKPAGANLKI
jgi:hypothetical protein